MSTVKIFRNPKCGTSRNTLALIRNAGIEPEIILYLETPPSRAQLVKLIQDCKLTPREALRNKGNVYEELKLDDPKWTDDELIGFMASHPILINRPIVVTSKGAKLCCPSELVLDILDAPQQGPFSKKDGEMVIDAQGKRAV